MIFVNTHMGHDRQFLRIVGRIARTMHISSPVRTREPYPACAWVIRITKRLQP